MIATAPSHSLTTPRRQPRPARRGFPGPLATGIALLAWLALSGSTASAQTNSISASSNVVSNVSGLATNLPDTAGSVLRVFGALLLVIGIFLGGVWFFRNWQRLALRRGGAPRLNVLEMKSLGQRQAIYVVGYQQQRLLLATSPAGVTLLSHLPAAEENEPAAAPGRPGFAEAFQMVLNRKA